MSNQQPATSIATALSPNPNRIQGPPLRLTPPPDLAPQSNQLQSWVGALPIALQALGALWVISQYEFDSPIFSKAIEISMLCALVGGFLPARLRLHLLSLTGILGLFLLLKAPLAIMLVLFGACSIAICLSR